MNIKHQLINAMERVTATKRSIGFSCGNQFIMTKVIAFKVSTFKNYF